MNSCNSLTLGFELVTAQMAENYLQFNYSANRKMRTSSKSHYAMTMKNGQWADYTSMIVFDCNGNLIDGQHRLMAQVESGVSVGYVVLRGVDTSVYHTIDSGIRRTISDRSSMNSSESAIAVALSLYEGGAPIRRCLTSSPSSSSTYAVDADVIEFGESDGNRSICRRLVNKSSSVRNNIGKLSIRAFAVSYAVVRDHFGEDVFWSFADELSKWDTDSTQARAAQKSLARLVDGKSRNPLEQLAIIIHAIEQVVDGKVPRMPTKATVTESMLESWRKKK